MNKMSKCAYHSLQDEWHHSMKKHVKSEHSKLAYKFVEKPINVETSQLNIQWLAKKSSTIIGHNSISFFLPTWIHLRSITSNNKHLST
jgi:hypothetical protein